MLRRVLQQTPVVGVDNEFECWEFELQAPEIPPEDPSFEIFNDAFGVESLGLMFRRVPLQQKLIGCMACDSGFHAETPLEGLAGFKVLDLIFRF